MFHLSAVYPRSNPRRQAFSMIEVMVAVAVLATVMTILASNLYTLNNARTTMKERAVAQEVGRLMSERIQSENFNRLGTSDASMAWSLHRRLTPWPGNSTPANPPMTEDGLPENNLITQGLLQQRSGVRDLRVYLEYYRNTALTIDLLPSADPVLAWREMVTTSGGFIGRTNHMLAEQNPLAAILTPGGAGVQQPPFIIMRIVVEWSPLIGGTQRHELVIAKRG